MEICKTSVIGQGSQDGIVVEHVPSLGAELAQLARLRIAVFAEWPYLYDGDSAYEQSYLEAFLGGHQTTLVRAKIGDMVIGMATASPMIDQGDSIKDPVAAAGLDVASCFYFGKSVLLSDYRGQGIGHRFFELRESAALGAGAAYAVFAAVIRDHDDPRKPTNARDLRPFWQKRGYRPLGGAQAMLSWKEIGAGAETDHPMQFWFKPLAH